MSRGERREPINVRVRREERAVLRARAAAEVDQPADRALSEMARRLLAYGALHMPAGWVPDEHWAAAVETPEEASILVQKLGDL